MNEAELIETVKGIVRLAAEGHQRIEADAVAATIRAIAAYRVEDSSERDTPQP